MGRIRGQGQIMYIVIQVERLVNSNTFTAIFVYVLLTSKFLHMSITNQNMIQYVCQYPNHFVSEAYTL